MSAALLLELQPALGTAEPEEPRGGAWGEPGEWGAPSQGWRVAPRGRVEQVSFRFLRARVCCAFVVTMTALLGQSTVLGQLLLFLTQPRDGSPGGGCDLVRSPWRGQELRRRLYRSCGVVEEHGHSSVLSSPGDLSLLAISNKGQDVPRPSPALGSLMSCVTPALTRDTLRLTAQCHQDTALDAGFVPARTMSVSLPSHRVLECCDCSRVQLRACTRAQARPWSTLCAHPPSSLPLASPGAGHRQAPRSHLVSGMSRWLGCIWGGMRLCGNAASLAQVATKQREVFRRLCNMYTVTPATACPQGINGS